jgi:copper chaperone
MLKHDPLHHGKVKAYFARKHLTLPCGEGLGCAGQSCLSRKEFHMLTFKVQDMTCNHCAGAITRAVKEVDGAAVVEVLVAEKRVNIDSKLAPAVFAEAITQAGFTPLPA